MDLFLWIYNWNNNWKNLVYFYEFDQIGFELKMSRHKRIRIYIECERVFNIYNPHSIFKGIIIGKVEIYR